MQFEISFILRNTNIPINSPSPFNNPFLTRIYIKLDMVPYLSRIISSDLEFGSKKTLC